MDNDSDGEEFYDAAEFQPNLSEGNSCSETHIEDDTTSCIYPNKPAVNFKSLPNHSDEVDVDQIDGPKQPESNKQEPHVTSDDQADNENNQNENTTTCNSNVKKENETPCKENETKETNSNIINKDEVNIAPVAPPRRRNKKKKERPLPVQDMDFNVEELKKDETKRSGMIDICGVDDDKVPEDAAVDADLDISTQEMSEILDRNNYTEVVSPQHMPVHLQRNKSQSISSIGSFCSVSSNVSFQEKMKRSASQGSIGSGNEKLTAPSTVVVDELTDQEILEQVVVKNLDTGECIPLSQAEEHVAAGVNPLALHIMRLTSEYSSKQDEGGSDKEDTADGNETIRKIVRKKKHLRGLFGRKVHKLKTTKDGGKRTEDSSSSDEEGTHQPGSYIKIKSANSKGVPIINKLSLIQDFTGQHTGAVWCMKFSCCGKLLATAGQDKVVHVWVLKTEKEYFEQMKAKYAKADKERPASPSGKDKEEQQNEDAGDVEDCEISNPETEYPEGFNKEPFCSYHGHSGDVLDLSWSKNYFLLSSSMDKTVRLWHISRSECLCCFQHIDFVTAIAFHPRDDRYFLSGSLDGKIRLWNIPDKKVALWNELEGAGSNLITAANFCLNGKFAIVGTYDGRCIFYITEHLKYFTQWEVRSSRKKQGRKISGIEQMPGEEKILITSNDSRIRLYSLKDHSLLGKYKGFTNSSSQIKGSFSHDGEFVISGSEDHFVYLWRAQHRVPSSRKDRNDFYESFSAQNTVVTAAIFAPCPWNVVPTEYETGTGPEVIVAADWSGSIKIFINKNQITH